MFEVLYEDNHLLVINKGVNILSQGDITGDDNLVDLIREYIKVKYNKPGNVYVGLIHRLDRMTGGLMVFAKTSKSASRLSKLIREHEFYKGYIAVTEGLVIPGIYEDLLIKDSINRKSFISSKGKKAILDCSLIDYKDNLSLVNIKLITGRHHQIRVQFSSRCKALYGDVKYGSKYKGDLALFANYLSFKHPTRNEIMEFKLDLPNVTPFNLFK